MATGNLDNLVPQSNRTKEEQRAVARMGGIASGKARKRKADLRRAAQELLNQTFEDNKGVTATGEEMLIKGLVANLADPKGKNWAKAVDFLMTLTGSILTKEQLAKIKAETELTKAKTKSLEKNGGAMADIEDLTPLADLLRGGENESDSND